MKLQITLLVLFCFITTGCATNPVTGKSELVLLSESAEIALGTKHYRPTQQGEGGLYLMDSELTSYVNQVGARLAAVSDRALPYEFVVLNDSTPNAWALPGGKIAINRGLLLALENEAELAAVLGHEIVHAAAKHGVKSIQRAILLQGAVQLAAIGVRDNEYADYIVDGAALGAQLATTRYGRKAELEADLYGMKYMALAGYDPDAAASLQEKFVALNDNREQNWLQGLFASHPPAEDRVAKNAETSATLKSASAKDWEIGEQRYQQHLAYLRNKQPAYQAFDQALSLLAKDETAVALKRVNRALQLEPGEARFHGLKAEIALNRGNYRGAIKSYDDALHRDDGYYEYYLGRGASHARLRNYQQAKLDLERSNALLPTSQATYELGELELATGNRSTAKQYFFRAANTSGPHGESARSAFVRLDITDNPSAYFSAQSKIKDGRFYSVVANNSGIRVRSVMVQFYAVINDRAYQARRSIATMETGTSVGIYPGWRVREEDQVEGIDVKVIDVRL